MNASLTDQDQSLSPGLHDRKTYLSGQEVNSPSDAANSEDKFEKDED